MISQRTLKTLTHTARMLQAMDALPDHPRAAEYAAQIAQYRLLWSILSPADRAQLSEMAGQVHDMTEPKIKAAVAALEG